MISQDASVNMKIDDTILFGMLFGVSIDYIVHEQKQLIQSLAEFDSIKSMSAIAYLLCCPQFHSNTIRLEVLIHLIRIFCKGTRAPDAEHLISWYNSIGTGYCRKMEDPPELIFTSNIISEGNNYCILNGIYIGGETYLQCLLNILQKHNEDSYVKNLINTANALLGVANCICQRLGIERNILGSDISITSLPESYALRACKGVNAVKFTLENLHRISVSAKNLSPFIFNDMRGNEMISQTSKDSEYVKCPICVKGNTYYLALPSVITATLRNFITNALLSKVGRNRLVSLIAEEVESTIRMTPYVEGSSFVLSNWYQFCEHVLCEWTVELNQGYILDILFVLDNFDNFDRGGLNEFTKFTVEFENLMSERIKVLYSRQQRRNGFRTGLTLFVWCGVGRLHFPPNIQFDKKYWNIMNIPLHDLYTLLCNRKFEFCTLFHIQNVINKYNEMNVEIVGGHFDLLSWQLTHESSIVGDDGSDRAKGEQSILLLSNSRFTQEHRYSVNNDLDRHIAFFPRDGDVLVVKLPLSDFLNEQNVVCYRKQEVFNQKTPAMVSGRNCTWWITLDVDHTIYADRYKMFWNMCTNWVSRIANVLDNAGIELSEKILWIRFTANKMAFVPATTKFDIVESVDEFESKISDQCIEVKIPDWFSKGTTSRNNFVERRLVEAVVKCVLSSFVRGQAVPKQEILDNVIPSESARYFHVNPITNFRKSIEQNIKSEPVQISMHEKNVVGMGLYDRTICGLSTHKKSKKQQCTSLLNKAVSLIEDDLIFEMKHFNRKQYLKQVLLNHESAALCRSNWLEATASHLALHGDSEDTRAVLNAKDNELTGIIVASRILLEIGQIECPLNGERIIGEIDLSRHMAMISKVIEFGGCSDAVHAGINDPTVTRTTFGEICCEKNFFEDVFNPYMISIVEEVHDQASADYHDLHRMGNTQKKSLGLDEEFLEAWRAEIGVSLSDTKKLCDAFLYIGYTRGMPMYLKRMSDAINEIQNETGVDTLIVETFFNTLLLQRRMCWRVVPEHYEDSDRMPWIGRRMLSVVRRPILQITDEKDPEVMIVPSLIDDWLRNVPAEYYESNYPNEKLRTKKMRSWCGRKNSRNEYFNNVVAQKLQKLGWNTKVGVRLQGVLGYGCDVDLGDIDVLAWERDGKRVLIVECKDLQLNITPKSVSSQIQKFRGENDKSGDADLVKKHLKRLRVCADRKREVGVHLDIEDPEIEGVLVMRRKIPIESVSENWKNVIRVIEVSELYKL